MHRFFQTFPRGGPGVGLLFLRVVVGLIASSYGWNMLSDSGARAQMMWAVGVPTALSGVALVIGLLTPLAAAIVGLNGIAFAMGAVPDQNQPIGSTPAVILLVTMCAVVILLGPGEFSIDARIFGRREIVVTRRDRAREP